jgi:3-oxoacyl-[acyl-carrier protein] reductase
MPGRLNDKVALITGASRGIGRATATLFGREGASVIVNYAVRADAAGEVVAELEQAGGRSLAVQADVADRTAVDSMVSRVLDEFGRIDILVNNAGILLSGNVMSMNHDELDQMISVNVKGIVNCVQAVVPGMAKRGSGKIVNISSLAGLGTAVPETTPYGLTKAAVISLTKRMAFELGPKGINVNAICPGFVQTDMLASIAGSAEELAASLAAPAAKAALGRVGQPADIATGVLFLSSDESSFITAQVLTIDGGRMDFLTHSA